MPTVSGKGFGKSDVYVLPGQVLSLSGKRLPLVLAVEGKELDPFHSSEHKALENDELLSTEKILKYFNTLN